MGYAACFGSAIQFAAREQKKTLTDVIVTARIGIGPKPGGGFLLQAVLEVSLPGIPRAEGEALVAQAHQVCPYSNATRGNMDVTLTLL